MRPDDQDRLLGQSPAFLQVLDEVSRAANLDKPLLIVGERGTGKELMAARVHFLSSRWQGPLVKFNCAAVNENLLESELFGHEAGAFTGAQRSHQGRFERAQGGTLFLDELANTSALVQEKLLRVIEYGEYERVGGSRTLQTDVRLVAATNEDLPTLVRTGRFRADLLDRLAFDVISLPPLRARVEDILLLAERFAINMASSLGLPLFAGFSTAAAQTLLAHHWPGNVRELKNVVERALYRNQDWEQPITEIQLDPFASPFRPGGDAASELSTAPVAATTNERQTTLPAQQLSTLMQRLQEQQPVDLKAYLHELENTLTITALTAAKHNQRTAARLLGLSYHQLRGLLRKHQPMRKH